MKKNPKILIAIADNSLRESLKAILNTSYNLILTKSTLQSLDCLKNDKSISLIFLESNPQKKENSDFLKEIKKNYPLIKITLVAKDYSDDLAQKANLEGHCGFLVKPLNAEEILRIVKSVIE